ncbi:MAG: PAS domain S-box protein [Methanomicrobiales archaeon]|nr:PAS domain S-box protein [Methanomicrobiales archaeon]
METTCRGIFLRHFRFIYQIFPYLFFPSWSWSILIPWLFVILLLTGMVIHIALGLYSRRFNGQPVQLPFEVLMYICAIWCATFIFDISSSSLPFKIGLMQVRYIGISFITLVLLLIAIFFTRHGSWLTKRRLALLLVIPVITVVLVLITQYSTLFRYNYTLLETAGGFSVLGFTNGIWCSAVYIPFNYVMEVATFILLLQVIFGGQKLYARQALLFFAAIVIPVVFDILFTLGISPVKGYNMTPSTFAFTGILLAIALFEFRFIDIVPIARTMLFEQMTDPMLVIDPEGRLVDFNPAAEQVLGFNRMKDIGKAASVPLKNYGGLMECIVLQQPVPCTITIGNGVGARLFEVSIQEMRSGGGMLPAKLVIMREVTDRKQAEKRAVHLASFPELTPVLTLEADPEGSVLYVNPSCRSSLQAMGETDPRIFIPPNVRDRLDGIPITEDHHEVHEIELHHRIFRENVYFTPQFSSIRIYATDITDRKRAEDALQETAEYLRKLIDFASAPIIVWNPDFTITRFNHAFEDMTLMSEQEIIGKSLDILFPNESRDSSLALIRETFKGERWESIKIPILSIDGTVHTVLWNSANILSSDGELVSTIAQGIDITGSEKTEEALRESELKYRNLYHYAQVGLFETTMTDAKVVACNQRYADMFGFPSVEEAIGKDVLSAYVNPDERALVGRILREQGHIDDHSVLFRNRLTGKEFRGLFSARYDYERDVAEGSIIDITDRKQTEDALQESERVKSELLKRLNEAQHIGMIGSWEWDLRTNHVWWSDETYRIFGVSPQDFVPGFEENGRFVHPDDSVLYAKSFEHSLQSGEPLDVDIRLVTRDGVLKYCHAKGEIIYDISGKPMRFIGTLMDSTERKKTDIELATAQQQYKELFESVSIGILRSTPGPEGTLVEVNPATVRIFEADSREQLLLVLPRDLYLDHDQRRRISEEILASGAIKGMEVRYKTLKGRPIWGRISSIKKVSPDGKIYFDNTIEDITDRKRAEEALSESEEKYREFFTTSRDSVFITTPGGQWVDFNDTALEMFGYGSREELMALPLPDLYLHPEQRGALLARIEGEGYVKEFAVQLMKKDGSVIDALITAVPLRNPDRSLKAFVGSIRDITDQKRAEEALRESERKFRETVKTLDEGYYSCTLEGMLLEHNVAFNRILGIDADLDLKGTQLPDFWQNPDERTTYVEELLAKGVIQNFSINAKTVQGVNIVVLANSHLVRDENARIVRIDGTFTDFTERKQVEVDLRESEEKFATAFKTSPYAITITRAADGSFIDVNDAFTPVTGFSHEEAVTNSSIGLDLWVDAGDRNRVIFTLLEGRNVNGEEFLFRRKDGAIITGLFSAQIISLNNEPCILSSINDISERKRAEDALRESETRFRTMADWTYDWEYWIDHQRNVVYMSPSVERVTGYLPKDFIDDRDLVDRIVHPDDRIVWDSHVFLHTQNEKADDPVEIEFRIVTREGALRWISHICRTICSDNHTCVGRRVSNRDITDRKRVEEALRETNEYLNNLFNYANAPIITWDPEFRITRFNHAFEHLVGRSQNEVLGENLAVLFPAGTRTTSLALIKKTLEGERWETVEIPILHADGNTHSVLWNSANVLDRDDKIIATIAQGMDITDQKNALDRIRWLASFPELNPNPVIEMNAEGEITFANAVTRTALQDLGLPDDPGLFIPGDKDEILRLLMETDEPQVYREITIGSEIFAENISLNRILQVARIYTLNITEQKRSERERERLFADLEQKNAELERFAYTASHDLKTPLITIRGFLGFVERDAQVGDMVRMRQDLARISNATVKMQELLDSLLELSRIGKIIGPPEPVSMTELSEEAAELLAVPIHERNVTLAVQKDLPEVFGDKKRLREVMVNLIENAVKFMGGQPAPLIEIGARYDAEKPVFFVRDNGIGIPPEYQGRLFSLFERLEVSVPGTGVGLALVKRIIEIHGGKVWVESEGAGKGTTFWFTLPGVPEIEGN